MNSPIRIHTTVLPGRRIEISSPHFTEGSAVDVVVTPIDPHLLDSLDRQQILRMPVEQRRKLMEQQSERLASFYESSEDRIAWQGGDILE